MKALRSFPMLLVASSSLAVMAFAGSARAQEPLPDLPPDLPTPIPVPGEGATPPAPPSEPVPPPSEPTTSTDHGTTSEPTMTHAEGEHGMGKMRLAGYQGGQFFLTDPDHTFLLVPMGRLQLDGYAYGGPGVEDFQRSSNGTGLKANLGIRRQRLEVAGRILKKWYFMVAGDFGNTSLDPNQKVTSGAAPADAFIGLDWCGCLKVQLGQFDMPFTSEAITGDKWWDFMERSMTSRLLGNPSQKDLGLMVRGDLTDKRWVSYAFAVSSGDGINRPNIDNRVDVMGRLLVRPLADTGSAMAKAYLGISARYGRRDPNYVRYDAPTLSTPGGYAFWSPVYGKGAAETHVMPSNEQQALLAELYFPMDRFDVRGEFLYLNEGRREAFASTLGNTERAGTMKAMSYYVQLTWWPWGTPRVNGDPATFPLPDFKYPTAGSKAARGLEIAVRWEQLMAEYDSVARSKDDSGVLLPGVRVGGLDGVTTKIRVNAFQLAATYWATKHLRITAEYSLYSFPGDPPGSPVPTNEAGAPGTRNTPPNLDASLLHEFSTRVAIAF
jgi:phosphate-selective porin